MNLKTFAQEGRLRLMAGVSRRVDYWGFDSSGQVIESPTAVTGGYTLRGEVRDDPRAVELWNALKEAIQMRGREVVIEEAAYTWFNRVMAMRILSRGGYDEPQLDVESGASSLEPLMLRRARQGHAPFLSDEDRNRLNKVVSDYSKEQEAMALLLTGYCRQHGTLSEVFGRPDDFTELLLPDDMLKSGGFLDLLQDAEQDADALTAEQYGKVELIGWLYQYYISEKKDEVFDAFNKGKKAEAKDIPAATQIFTPNWIVKYMVENTAGKAWLDKHPTSPLKEQMTYLVENEADGTRQPIIDRVEDLTLIDPACGSGHILVEGFDLIYQMYQEEFASPTEAVKSILEHNLFGLDIDDRAAQLSTFAVLLKAAQYDRDIWDRGYRPHVYAMPYKRTFDGTEVKTYLGEAGKAYANELEIALSRMWDAKNLGAVMKLRLSDQAHAFITARQKELESAQLDFFEEATIQDMTPFIRVLLTMTRRYTAVVANPPYMGQKNMNADLKAYVNKNYPVSKSDLCTVFLEVLPNLNQTGGTHAFIIPPSWMFLSSFEKLRGWMLSELTVDSVLHLSRGVFGADFGSVAAVNRKAFPTPDAAGTYLRMVERTFQEFHHYHLRELFLLSNGEENFKFDFSSYEKDDERIEASEKGKRVYYSNIPQSNFSKIPGSPIAYWVSDGIVDLFSITQLSSVAAPRRAIQTGDSDKFRKYWTEVSKKSIEAVPEKARGAGKARKWYLAANGGKSRKWYGNIDFVILWGNHGQIVKSTGKAIVPNEELYFDECVVWNRIASGDLSFRYHNAGLICGDASPFLHSSDRDVLLRLMALMNGSVGDFMMKIVNPTLAVQTGSVAKVPIAPLVELTDGRIERLAQSAVSTARREYDSGEWSKNFRVFPLVSNTDSLEAAHNVWDTQVSTDFFQLHKNEEELNRIFIDIYGLQDELTPEVPLKDITILQEELDSDDLEALEDEFRAGGGQPIELPIKRDVVMQQFLSYCVGLMMGRYRLDEPGLHIAHPEPTAEEVASYSYNRHTVEIDDDAILPLMGSACQFPDDVLHRVYGLLDVIWGEETRIANVNFLEECLGKSLEKYLVKDFFKDHCKRYKKKPIYWLFASKKGAFQVLVYMHRMNAFTVQKIRDRYLLDHLRQLRSEIERLEALGVNASKAEAKKLEQLRKDEVECREYELMLKDVADQQIAFDLNDGVTKNHKLFGEVVAKIK